MLNHTSNNNQESTQPQAKQTGITEQWGGKLAFFFTYTHLSHDLTTGLLAALLPFIREDLGLNYLQSGLLITAFALTSGFSQLLGGWLCERISPPRAIALGLGGVGLSAIATSFASSYYMLLVILIILGLMAGFYHPSAVSTLTTHFEPNRRGRVVALHMAGGGLGFGLGPLLGAIIASHFNWHLAYAILGIPAIVAACLVFTQLKIPVKAKQVEVVCSSGSSEQKPIGLFQIFKSTIGILAVSITMQLITGPLMSFASLFLIDVHHLSAAAGSMWITIIRMGGLAGSICGGWLADKWGRRNAIFLTLIMFGPVVFLIAKLPFGVGLGAAFVMFGCLMSMRETTIQTFLMDNTPPRLRARVIGIYFSFGQQGSSIIQPVAGNFMDAVGIAGVFNGIAFISIGLSVIAIIIAISKIGRSNALR
jgi:FSR family fosmidomycin resistance protein-like MFS transporter